MTIAELEQRLPNGFHDAKLCSFTRDIEHQTITLNLDILVGSATEFGIEGNLYRKASMKFIRAFLMTVEQPDLESRSFPYEGCVWFVITQDEPGAIPEETMRKIPNDTHTYSLFVQEWLSNIHIVAADLIFEWA